MFEVYAVTAAGRLGECILATDDQQMAADLMADLRDVGRAYLYVVDSTVSHEFRTENAAIIFVEDE